MASKVLRTRKYCVLFAFFILKFEALLQTSFVPPASMQRVLKGVNNMNPMDMIKNLQGMQSKMQDMQNKLNDVKAEGESGGGMVKIVLTGQYSVVDVKIAKEVIDPEDPELLEDLVLSAFTDASNKIKVKIQNEAAAIAGEMNLPPEMMGM